MGITGDSGDKRDYYYHNKLNEFLAINTQYKLNIDEGILKAAAWGWADAREKSENKWWESGDVWFHIVFTAVSIYMGGVSGYSGWVGVMNALNAVGQLANLAVTAYGVQVNYRMLGLGLESVSLQSALGYAQNANTTALSKSNQMVELFIYDLNRIYPNGNIYKAQQAGDMNTFSPQIAHSGAKGFLGEFHTLESDEKVMNRGHVAEAGNVSYLRKNLGVQGHLSVFTLENNNLNAQSLAKRRETQVNRGMEALMGAGFYAGLLGAGGESIYQQEHAEDMMEEIIEGLEDSIKEILEKGVKVDDMLEKLKCYQKALFQDFNYYYDRSKDREMSVEKYNENYAIFEGIQNSDKSIEVKARSYLLNLSYYMRLVQSIRDKKRMEWYFWGNLILIVPSLINSDDALFDLNYPNYAEDKARESALITEYFNATSVQSRDNVLKQIRELRKKYILAQWDLGRNNFYTLADIDPINPLFLTAKIQRSSDYDEMVTISGTMVEGDRETEDEEFFKEEFENPLRQIEKFNLLFQNRLLNNANFVLKRAGNPLKIKQDHASGRYFVGVFKSYPYFRFLPLNDAEFEALAKPIPKSPELDTFDFSSL